MASQPWKGLLIYILFFPFNQDGNPQKGLSRRATGFNLELHAAATNSLEAMKEAEIQGSYLNSSEEG